ncbi:MAG: DUF3466 family protein, partial [Pirellulales bacterium]|nr:DUF3466 family protein [Pirellulales bacterium]
MKKLTAAVVLAVALGWNVSALAGPMLEVGGSPEYDAASDTGIQAGGIETYPGRGVNNNGMAVGKGFKYDSGDYLGERAVRWDWTGTAATELGTLGASNSGYNVSTAYAVNDAGTTAGHCLKFVAGFHKGNRAVRWDAGNTEATELDHLGLDANGSTDSMAFAINNAGTIVGLSEKWVSSTYKGSRAVRWDAGGTAAAELGHLGTDGDGITHAVAYAINDAGTIVGYSSKYVSGSYQGERAVRWDAGSTTATELDTISTDASGIGFAKAWVVNNAGTAVGYGTKYVSGVDKGER